MKAKITKDNILEHLVEYQFNLIELTTLDALFEKDWRTKWTLTPEQFEQFRKYSIPLLKKIYKFNTNKAKWNFEWIIDKFGLKVK